MYINYLWFPPVTNKLFYFKRGELNAFATDGGQVWAADKCGLVAAMVEQYDKGTNKRNKHFFL